MMLKYQKQQQQKCDAITVKTTEIFGGDHELIKNKQSIKQKPDLFEMLGLISCLFSTVHLHELFNYLFGR